ncbi:MAG: tRNA (adenosine(37)-N6)-threonylcarbamoyltransferase complex dimerization subunit type 1 TsaB, partial [Prevotella sp.]|nr:tRNA (adenosine(37)-N6)-threonylcarbamoyltransferase complex dimerization subunit type 1 TsaB [Prevotella sp.]
MATILHIETSTEVCSVAVSQDGLCVFEREDREGPNHAVKSGVFIDEALSYIDSQLLTLDAVAVSGGPGSYTGLRIGVSTAKGVCFGRDARLISVPTLEVLCVPILLQEKVKEDDALLCPMLDARRMEVYAALFDRSLREIRPTQADIVDGDTYKAFLDERPVYFFGNG